MSIEDYIIFVYCKVTQYYPKSHNKLRSRGFMPSLDDEEVITMELIGEFLGFDADKHIWQYFTQHWKHYFPGLSSRTAFTRQSASLWQVKQTLQVILSTKSHDNSSASIVDGFPIPVCKYARSGRHKLFQDDASFGFCAAQDEKYFGFKGHIIVNKYGFIQAADVTGANIDERQALLGIAEYSSKNLLGDKGYISEEISRTLKSQYGVSLHTPVRANMEETREKKFLSWMKWQRKRVETVISQLVERFNIQRVRARDLWHFNNRINRKILSHTIAMHANIYLGRELNQLGGIIG